MEKKTVYLDTPVLYVCVCVCVRVCKRHREGGGETEFFILFYWESQNNGFRKRWWRYTWEMENITCQETS